LASLAKFNEIIDRVLGNESGYVNDPNDPGGETNWGISKRTHPHLDIKNLTREQAVNIYFKEFWEPLKLSEASLGIAYQAMDFAVNSGILVAIMKLQKVIGVAEDGHFGPVSLAALMKKSETDILMLLMAERLEYMTKLKNWPNAGKGWANRIAKNLRYGALDT